MNCTSKTELRPDCRILIAEPNLGLAIAGAVSCLHKSHSLSAQVPFSVYTTPEMAANEVV